MIGLRRSLLLLPLALLSPALLPAADELPASLERIACEVRTTPADLKWQQVPWVLDLEEAVRTAKEEKRPVMIWVSGDEPLERC